jgi:uncharacterized protein with HEPN domain
MLLAARSIQDFTSGQTQESFVADRLRIRAIEREFEIHGEAARNVDEMTREQFPGLDFRAIVGMRNIVSHDYRRVKAELHSAIYNFDPSRGKLPVPYVSLTIICRRTDSI